MINKQLKLILNKFKIKRIFVIFAGFFVVSSTFASYEQFLDNLRETGIDVDQILDSNEVSRYELTRLLNGVNCKDCVNTPQWMIDQYTSPWWSDFSALPGKDFQDIGFKGGIYKGETYYYCVAYVGDNIWMRGYPEGLSPICDGKFCGNRNTTIGEFLQVILNIADQYTYTNYLMNWSKVKTWMDGLEIGSYPDNNLNTDDIALINELSNKNMSGTLPSEFSMQTYLKYCMFNTDTCGMQNFGDIVQGYWPVAELNILYDHNIVEHEKFKDGDIHELVEGEYVLKTLYNLFKIIDCEFDNNYDCDELENNEDNCPNTYSPHQLDTDGDGVGDVCDDDIDGDGILNPIGIVDDLGRIVISKRKDNMDNCLFIVNPDQADMDDNGVGNACEDNENYLGMYIKTSGIITNAPLIVDFEAVTKGDIIGDIVWDFGDGSQNIGDKVSHEFINNGTYDVSVKAKGINNDALASTTILVGTNSLDNHSIQISADKIGGELPLETKLKANTNGLFDKLVWNFGDGNTVEKYDTKEIIKLFRDQNSYMVTVKGFKDDEVVAVANMIVGAGTLEIASNLSVNNLSPNKGQTISLKTDIFGFSEDDIQYIEWDRGNEEIEKNNDLNTTHIYDISGPNVIIQKILLKNNQEIQNFITINVEDSFLKNSYRIDTSINELVVNSFNNIKFKVSKRGEIPETLLVLNRYMDNSLEKQNEDLEIWPKYFDHKYTKKGVFFPKNSVFVNECISLDTVETIAITNNDLCLEAKINNTLDKYKCDMDNDSIPDICDDDIDGDGTTNLIGVINFEQEDCNINADNINWDIINEHNDVCGLDSCPTVNNEDQMDLNNNGRGDSCERLYDENEDIDPETDLDTDGDGIIDPLDGCPLIPENYNGIEDYDGCPEIGANVNCNSRGIENINSTIIAAECLSCPCAFSDYSNDLVLDDKVKATLWDFNMEVLYSESIPEPIRQYLN